MYDENEPVQHHNVHSVILSILKDYHDQIVWVDKSHLVKELETKNFL